jgi:hypothetical protein
VRPIVHGQGQAPRLLVGRRRDLVRLDTSAFAELQKPAEEPEPSYLGELPVRTFTDVTKGMGLSHEAERDLMRAMEGWMAAPDPVSFRGQVTRGLRTFAPDNYAARNELWRRCSALYRSMRGSRPNRIPQSTVIQKALPGGKGEGRDPSEFDPEQVAMGIEVELEHTSDREVALEICLDHLTEDPLYYTHLKEMEDKYAKGGDWEAMAGIDGGLRRVVPGGYEYLFEGADLSAAPAPELARVMSYRAVTQPPELLWCYSSEEAFEKAAGHKYIKRIPTGKPRPKWRYIYKHPVRRGLVVDEHLVEGTKFKVKHAGRTGHFEILSHDAKTGVVTVRHDESGKTANIRKRDLTRMLASYHAQEGKEAAAAVPLEEKATEAKLPRVKMADLARGEWERPVGFEPTEEAALELAKNLKRGWQYAAIKQPTGYLVVAKRDRGREKGQRIMHGPPVKVFLRGEKPLKATYTLMEAEDVIASHDPASFNIRRDYPEGVQERQYHESPHERAKVERIAQEMEPAFVINNNPDGVNGTPIISQDGVVLGGNARTMGIQRAYAKEPESAKKYRNYLIAHAKDYGFNAADVRGMKQPILVRRSRVGKRNNKFQTNKEFDQTKYNAHLRLLGRRMNEGMTQGLDPRSEEVALGKNFVNDHMLRVLTDRIDEGQTLDSFLQTERSRDFVKALWANGIIDALNAGQYTYGKDAEGDEGLLNKEGRARLERVLVGKIIDSPTLLDRMTETQRQSLANSVTSIIVAQQSGWDIVPQLKRAIQIDQSIQKMEKELGAVGQPRKALKKFLTGKQGELPGVSSMRKEVRADDMLHHLLIIVREKAGTRIMPRDFAGFALRAREDAKKNVQLTGQDSLFGGAEHQPKRESPVDALDIEFGVTPPRKEEKAERERAERAEAKRQEEEKKRLKAERKKAAEGGLFRGMSDEADLIKASAPNRLMDRAVNHAELLVDAAVTSSMMSGPMRVDGGRIARRVLADIDEAIRKDPELARDQGRSPIDAKVVRGIVEALVQMRGKDLLEKARKKTDHVGMALEAHYRGQVKRPPGAGWTPPSGKRKSWRKRVGGKYVYWTARKGYHGEPVKTLFGEDHPPLPKPTKADRLEAAAQVESSDTWRRADEIADRLQRHGLDKLPGKYAEAVRSWLRLRPGELRRVRNASGIDGIHEAQSEALDLAARMGNKMREFELRQETLFGDKPPEPERLELTPAEVKEHAQEAYRLGASKDPGEFSRYMSDLTDKHGEAQAKLVMDQVAYLQEARRGRATVKPPARSKGTPKGQQGLFSGHQATQTGEQGELFRSRRMIVKHRVFR